MVTGISLEGMLEEVHTYSTMIGKIWLCLVHISVLLLGTGPEVAWVPAGWLPLQYRTQL